MNVKSLLLASVVAFGAAGAAQAADAIVSQEPVPVVAPTFSWTGPYLGAQVGWGWARADFEDLAKANPNGFLGGIYGGYNFDVGNNVVLGLEGDVTYNDISGGITNGVETLDSKLRWAGAVRARAGYAIDRFLPYIAGGVAFGDVKSSYYDGANTFTESKTQTGWTVGAGVDYAATDNVVLRLEYRYTDFGHKDYDFGVLNPSVREKLSTNEIRIGVAYKF